MQIPYLYKDQKTHIYYPDFFIELDNGDRWVVEIKPSNQTRAPREDNAYAMREWIKNNFKWSAAREFCGERGMKFMILTEKTINRLK